jgi:membrane dipeptidase
LLLETSVQPPHILPKITAAPLDLGYFADDLRKILGGNLMRVFGAIQAAGSV